MKIIIYKHLELEYETVDPTRITYSIVFQEVTLADCWSTSVAPGDFEINASLLGYELYTTSRIRRLWSEK